MQEWLKELPDQTLQILGVFLFVVAVFLVFKTMQAWRRRKDVISHQNFDHLSPRASQAPNLNSQETVKVPPIQYDWDDDEVPTKQREVDTKPVPGAEYRAKMKHSMDKLRPKR